jgi:hypothetical protein
VVADATHGWFFKPVGTHNQWCQQDWCSLRMY